MKRILLIALIGLLLGCATETVPAPEIDIDATVEARVAKKIEEKNPKPTSTPKPEPTSTPKPEPTSTPKPEPTSTPKPEPTSTPNLLKNPSGTTLIPGKPHIHEFVSAEIDNDGAIHIQVSNPTPYPFKLYFWVIVRENFIDEEKLKTETSCIPPNQIRRVESLNAYDLKNKQEIFLAMSPEQCGDQRGIYQFEWTDQWKAISSEANISPMTKSFLDFSDTEINSLNEIYKNFETNTGIKNWESRKKDLDRNYRSEIFNDIWEGIEISNYNEVKTHLEKAISAQPNYEIKVDVIEHGMESVKWWGLYDTFESADTFAPLLEFRFKNNFDFPINLRIKSKWINKLDPLILDNGLLNISSHCLPEGETGRYFYEPRRSYGNKGSGYINLDKDSISIEKCFNSYQKIDRENLDNYGIYEFPYYGLTQDCKYPETPGAFWDIGKCSLSNVFEFIIEGNSEKTKILSYVTDSNNNIVDTNFYDIPVRGKGEGKEKISWWLDRVTSCQNDRKFNTLSALVWKHRKCFIEIIDVQESFDKNFFYTLSMNPPEKKFGSLPEPGAVLVPTPTPSPKPPEYTLDKPASKLTGRFSGFSCVSDFNLKILNTGDKEDMNMDVKWYDKEGNLLASGSETNPSNEVTTVYFKEETPNGTLISQHWTMDFGASDCWNYSDVTKDLYGKGVIFINGEEFPFVEVTIE